jgi:small subunit ribosomal protein S8
MLNDPLANMLSKIMNAERRSIGEVSVKPSSNVLKQVLSVMQDNGYVGSFKEVEDCKGNILKIKSSGQINKCGAIKPRFSVKKDGYVKFEKRFLPAQNFGIIIVSTSKGIMTHDDAKKKGVGGSLLAYCY